MTSNSTSNNPLIFSLLTKFEQENSNRRSKLLRQVSVIQSVAFLIGSLVMLLLAFLSSKPELLWVLAFMAFGGLGSFISFLLAPKLVDVGFYFLLITMFFVIMGGGWILGSRTSALGFFLWIPLVAGLLSNKRVRDVIVTTVLSAISVTILSLGDQDMRLYHPIVDARQVPGLSTVLWILLLAIVGVTVVAFANSLRDALSEISIRTNRLAETLQALSNASEVGRDVARSLTSITAELGAASRQQASGANEQVSAIVEATSSLEELGETAQHIAGNSLQVAHAAEQSLTLAKEVEARSESLNILTEQGQQSVSNVITVIEAVRNRIESLAQRLLVLTERSKEIGNIIDLMREIADETHLLALNAAIESADGRTISTDGGRRFGVIAGEVKNLADRSLEAAQDVQKVIVEVQGAIATAVLAAEEGKKETVRAVNQAYTSGQVIDELGRAAASAVQSSSRIVSAVGQVGTLSEEITLATRQQGSASEQVVLTMRTIQQVAQEGASGVTQVATTVRQIGDLAARLQGLLDETTAQAYAINSDFNSKNGSSKVENAVLAVTS